jgi:3-hydroxyisobutyryl-CoA hydrolase
MRTEFRLGVRTSTRPDFIEGVRAVLIDKDQKPKWQPGSIEDIDMGDVKAVFAPFETPADELMIPDTVVL